MYEFTEEQEQSEFDYHRAKIIAEIMLDCGLISLSEYTKLIELNRQSFSPFLVEIMPEMT